MTRPLVDMQGKELKVGQTVAKAYYSGDLRLVKVTNIVNGKVYLGNATNPLYYPWRVLIVAEE
jgi:hypothetical protein